MAKLQKLLLPLVATTIIATGCDGKSDPVADSLDSLVQTLYAPGQPGAAILIAKGDSIVYERYIGLADLARGTAIDSATRFNIASISKQFTAVAALQLAEMDRLDFDTTVTAYLPRYTAPLWRGVTLRGLASHSSGIPDLRDRSDRRVCVFADEEASKAYLDTLSALEFEPGRYYNYQNPTFILIADAVEAASGRDFYDYQQSELFDCAGMGSTFYFTPADTAACHSTHAYVKDDNGQWAECDYGEETFFATRPDGGIYSTPRDLLRWQNALRDNRLLTAESLAEAYRPHINVAESPLCDYQRRPNTSYGLGWFIDTTPGYPVKIYHTGDNGGYQAYMAAYPEADVKIIVLENRNDRPRWHTATAIDSILRANGLLQRL